eukprot:g52238.t1
MTTCISETNTPCHFILACRPDTVRSMKSFFLVALLCAIVIFSGVAEAKLKPKECEVCLKVMTEVETKVKAEKLKKPKEIEKAIMQVCTAATDEKEKRLCYYIGGSKDAATSMLKELSSLLKNSLPPENICVKLKKKDLSICELQYPEPIDLATTDLQGLRVKQLKTLLKSLNEKCVGCTSKEDFIKKLEEIKAQQASGKGEKEL